ncbi:MAG: hypothetical protein IPM41_05945 [Sphingomonadales bacterium]|nr:hypothetical protein [Sphingomonadales bacterium]
MRKIGLIGGMSWYSTEFYYRTPRKTRSICVDNVCAASDGVIFLSSSCFFSDFFGIEAFMGPVSYHSGAPRQD